MSNGAGQELSLENVIKQAAGTLTQCQQSVSTILDHLGLDIAKEEDPGVSRGGSTLNARIGEIELLNQRSQALLNDLARIEGELRLL